MPVDEEGVEEAAVVGALFAELRGVFVGEGPADVVVRADVVDPGAAAGDVVAAFDGLGEHGGVACGEGFPGEGHLEGVVGELAFVAVDVLDDEVRVDDGFGFEEDGRGGDAAEAVEGSEEFVDFG